MVAHTLPGLGLTGNYLDGQDNWGETMDANIERLTIAVNTRVLGTVANAGALPADPADGDSYLQTDNGHIRSWDDADEEWMDTTPQNGWRLFREDTEAFMARIGGAWVAEDSGPSLPEGGTTGQVLAKASDADGDAEWIDPAAASLPAGTTGYFLRKTADSVEWVAIRQVPTGGTTGQLLAKASASNGDTEWVDPPEEPAAPLYRFGGFFTTAPAANEVLMIHVATDAFSLADDLAGSRVSVGTNPAATWTGSLKKNGVEAATVAISTGGVVTMTSSGAINFAAGDVISFVGPASAGTITNTAFTFKGTI